MGSNGKAENHAAELNDIISTLILPDAHSSYAESSYVIFGVPFDGTSSYRKGSRFSPNRIREAYDNLESFDPRYETNYGEQGICDLGNLQVSENVEEVINNVEAVTGLIVKDGKIPIILGGEHSITVGAIRSFPEAYMIIIDAHSDFRNEYMGNKYNHACVTRRSLEILGRERIASIGTRSVSQEEFESEAFSEVRFIFADEVRKNGIASVIDEITSRSNGRNIYFSIDMDGIDPAFAPGVGTPEPYGLLHTDVRDLINAFAGRIVGFDIVEITSLYDNGNTVMLAAKLIQDFIGSRSKLPVKK